MEDDKLDKLAAALLMQVRQSFNDRLLEVDAALSAQRFLIEQLLANAFLANPAEVDTFIAGLVEKTRQSATTSGPMNSEDKAEMQARVAARLLLIGESVRRRLAE
jgi:hypothetical protein